MVDSQFNSTEYWRRRYEKGNNSGSGSYGRLSRYKANFFNGFVALNDIESVIDFGCGDGNQAASFDVPSYLGLDVSDAALERSRLKCATRKTHIFDNIANLENISRSDATLSMDVIYHLVEDDVFSNYIQNLFTFAKKFCVIYASNSGSRWTATHVRHRSFTELIAQTLPHWRLAAHVPNAYPFLDTDPDNTSFADFFVYAVEHTDCVIPSPGRSDVV